MKPPNSLPNVLAITEKYFHEHGEIKPTILCFTNDGFTVQGFPIPECLLDKARIADTMIQAVIGGATAVALVVEAWASQRDGCPPTDDPTREEALVVTYQQPDCSYASKCRINRQRFGRPRLSKWETTMETDDNDKKQLVFQALFEKAQIRKNTVLTCDLPQPSMMLVLARNEECLRNDAGQALIVSSEMMAHYCIDKYTNGGEYRCVLVLDHPDLLMKGFVLTGTGTVGFPKSPREAKAAFELIENEMKRFDRW